jgi:hypothetical protein
VAPPDAGVINENANMVDTSSIGETPSPLVRTAVATYAEPGQGLIDSVDAISGVYW